MMHQLTALALVVIVLGGLATIIGLVVQATQHVLRRWWR